MKMNKKLLASLVAVGILSTGTAFAAANPFDDVPKDHWSYDAVQTLTDDGIVDGYGDNTYRGDKLMTRYEMAQIVGRAVSQSKKADATQKATIDKLAAEYSNELQSLGVRVGNVEKKTKGVQDVTISHWFQSENTYGNTTQKGDDSIHEYALKYRLGVGKQVSPKLSMYTQMEAKSFFDDKTYADQGRDGVYMRLAYATYKPNDKITITAGKNAYWLAGGLLGDDFTHGIDITAKLDDKTTFELMHGRYWVDQFSEGNRNNMNGNNKGQITYAGLNTKFGIVDFGAHYMFGQQALSSAGFEARRSNIWAVTSGVDLGKSGVNLSVGYAKNTKQDNNNKLGKVQLYKKFGKADVILQYWRQQGLIDLPMENGNHMAWWGDMYTGNWGDHRGSNGVDGYRAVVVYPWSDNSYSEFYYGDYKDIATKEKSTKAGFSLTFMY